MCILIWWWFITTEDQQFYKYFFPITIIYHNSLFWKLYSVFRIRIRNFLYGYGSGSGSFHKQAKNEEKPCYLGTVLWLLWLLSLKNDVKVPSKRNKRNNNIFVGILKVTDEKRRIQSRIRIRIRLSKVRIRIKMSRIRNTGCIISASLNIVRFW